MLEARAAQSTGLLWHGQPQPLRVLPILPSGEAADHLALWQACALMQQQGYPVVVLDGTEQETASSPGLQHLLQPQSGFAHMALPLEDGDSHSIATLPAARGLVQLAHKAQVQHVRPLQLLYRHLRNHAVVVILAPAPLLAPLLQGCTQAPIQLVPSQRNSVVRSYRALKQVFMDTGLMPRLTAMRPQDLGLDPVLKSIAQCAMHHLHCEPLAEQLDPDLPRQLRRWSLQCLEHAESVYPHQEADAASAIAHPFTPSSPLAWSH